MCKRDELSQWESSGGGYWGLQFVYNDWCLISIRESQGAKLRESHLKISKNYGYRVWKLHYRRMLGYAWPIPHRGKFTICLLSAGLMRAYETISTIESRNIKNLKLRASWCETIDVNVFIRFYRHQQHTTVVTQYPGLWPQCAPYPLRRSVLSRFSSLGSAVSFVAASFSVISLT